MDVEKLIGVKKRPILYESTKKAYKDAARRDDAWKEVAEDHLLTYLHLKQLHILRMQYWFCGRFPILNTDI